MLTILGGESLLNDGTALTLYQVAVAGVVSGVVHPVQGFGVFLATGAGGIVIGLLIGKGAVWLLCRLDDGVLENTVSLLVPFVAFVVADSLHTSGVLAVVLAGLTIGHAAPRTLSYAARLQSEAVWRMIDFLLESVVFADHRPAAAERPGERQQGGDLLAAGRVGRAGAREWSS